MHAAGGAGALLLEGGPAAGVRAGCHAGDEGLRRVHVCTITAELLGKVGVLAQLTHDFVGTGTGIVDVGGEALELHDEDYIPGNLIA